MVFKPYYYYYYFYKNLENQLILILHLRNCINNYYDNHPKIMRIYHSSVLFCYLFCCVEIPRTDGLLHYTSNNSPDI